MGVWKEREELTEPSFTRNVWEGLFEMAHRQAVTGLFMDGVARSEVRPENELWDRWLAHLWQLERANSFIAQRGEGWIQRLADAGISATVFKGASVASWYPEPLHRSPGDVDVVITQGWKQLETVLKQDGWTLSRQDEDEVVLQEKSGVWVEFHRQWEYLYNPLTDRRLQQWCQKARPDDRELYFVCLVLHIQRHFLTYGIGLKQVCDVAVMLQGASLELDKVASMLRRVHAVKFSRLLFGFMKLHLGKEIRYPLSPITEGRDLELLSRVLLHEGYQSKMDQVQQAEQKEQAIGRIISNAAFWSKRCFSLFRIMPGEATCFLLNKIMKRLGRN